MKEEKDLVGEKEIEMMGDMSPNVVNSMPEDLKKQIREKVEELKVEHDLEYVSVFVAETTRKKSGYYISYFRKIRGAKELSRYVFLVQADPVEANYELAKMCFLDGDKEPLSENGYTDTGLYMASGKFAESLKSELVTF